jgi:uncharacterized membrane protein
MSIAMGRMTAAAGGPNTILTPPRPNAQNNTIVRSSPDLLYNVCVYDVSAKPLRISAEVPQGTYWSVSFYDMNTNNYRVINDGQATAGAVLLVLMKPGATGAPPSGAEIVTSPTDRGIVLFRTLINDESRFAEIDAARRQAKCAPL